MQLPLKGLIVLEFCQYLSGPFAGLRLADMGATVIKLERPVKGEAGRQLAIKNLWVDESSLLFHTINRNKGSVAADLKNPEDMAFVKKIISRVDVVIHNFRPGVMESLNLDFESVKKINPKIIYAEISGYGKKGPWCGKPGQDLLAQSLSGLTFTTGNKNDLPTAMGLSIGDYLCGNQAVQAILAALIRRHKTGKGALLELSLLESLIDLQFEFFTTYFQNKEQPQRSEVSNGNPLLGAPYGIYQTADGYIAIAMMPLNKLGKSLGCSQLDKFSQDDAFKKRDEIKAVLFEFFKTADTNTWVEKAKEHDLWIMPVLNWKELRQSSTYQQLNLEQEIISGTEKIITTRCPIRYNNQYFLADKSAPKLNNSRKDLEAV